MPYDDEEKRKLTTDVHRIVTSREVKFTNFVEVITLITIPYQIAQYH